MMEALNSSETSVLTRATRCNIPEDAILHSHRRENLKSYKVRGKWLQLYEDITVYIPTSCYMGKRSKAKGTVLMYSTRSNEARGILRTVVRKLRRRPLIKYDAMMAYVEVVGIGSCEHGGKIPNSVKDDFLLTLGSSSTFRVLTNWPHYFNNKQPKGTVTMDIALRSHPNRPVTGDI
jgi:hypothetical protein